MSAAALQPDQPEVIVRVMVTHNRAIDDFLADCRARDWSERTLNTYAATLNRFTDRLPADHDVAKTTIDDIRRYRASRQRTVSRNTLAGEEAHLASYFGWLYRNRIIAKDPMGQLDRTKRTAADDLDVTTIDTAGVRKLLLAATPGAELNAIAILAYLGPRRHAVAMLRLGDYDQVAGQMRFVEKGRKIIWKPVPDELAAILDASIARGDILDPPADYLVPPQGYLTRPGTRDDRVIWRIVKAVGDRAGIETHVHALRAAFAVFYLDHNPDDLLGLKDLLGHKSVNTTLIYLRRRNRQAGMERVRSLSWAETAPSESAAWLSAIPQTSLGASLAVGAGGFEPPLDIQTSPAEGSPPTSDDSAHEAPFEIVIISAAEAALRDARDRLHARGLDAETCHRLVGLTEGEGHFGISLMKKGNWRCHFSIKLRADDRPLLEELHDTFRLGRIFQEAGPSRHHPCARWEVGRKEECEALADIFRVYPLRSKKRRDAAIWLEALDEWALIYMHESANWSRIADLARQLREVRKFNLTRDDLALLGDPGVEPEAMHPTKGLRPSGA